MKENNTQNPGPAQQPPRAGAQSDAAMTAILAALEGGQAPMLDDLKRVWTSKEANRVIRELARQGVAGVHRRRLRKADGERYRFGTGAVEQKGPGRFLLTLADGSEAYLTAKSSKLVVAGDKVQAFLAAEDGVDVEGLPSALIVRDFDRQHVARARALPDGRVAFFLDNRVEDVQLDMAVPDARPGDIWFCVVQERGLLRDIVPAKAIARIGNEADKGVESHLAFVSRFAPSARCDEAAWPTRLSLSDAKDDRPRVDIREVPLATIDGESTNDFDDAVAALKVAGGWDLWVAIADVSAFVTRGSALDEFAQRKMTSVYLPHEVHPMLPRSLSNGVCSLNPGEERLALCCKLRIADSGDVESYEFFRGTMKSHARLTYAQTQQHLDGAAKLDTPAVEASIKCLSDAAVAMRAAGMKEGRLDMGEDEVGFDYDANGKISGLHSDARLWSHKIVEECMLAANRSAAELVETRLSTGIFRNHAGIKASGLIDLRETLDAMGIKAGATGAQITQGNIAEILAEAKGLGKYSQARSAILSGMSSANYETVNTGHFSLVAPYYCHFTSPIRRYADLMVHRMIKATLDSEPSPYTREESESLSKRASMFSQLASQAENESRKLLILGYVKGFQGEAMDARVATIGERGLWVALPFPGASLEFFVSAKAMKNAGMQWSEVEQSWMTQGVAMAEGDKLRCSVASCDAGSRRVELAPVAGPRPEPRVGAAKI